MSVETLRQAWFPSDEFEREPQRANWWQFVQSLLDSSADGILMDDEFYVDINSETDRLLRRLNSFDENLATNLGITLVGRAGSGKTSFLKCWRDTNAQNLLPRCVIEDGLNDRQRWWADPTMFTRNYQQLAQNIACRIYENARKHVDSALGHDFESTFVSCLEDLRARKFAGEDNLTFFRRGLVNQSDDFLKKYPGLTGVVHLSIVVAAVTQALKAPTWLVFDNVDLLGLDSQRELLTFVDSLRRDVIEKCRVEDWACLMNSMVVVRPETAAHHKAGAFAGYLEIDYPTPDCRHVAHRKLRTSIERQTRRMDAENVPLSFEINGRQYRSWLELGTVLMKNITDVMIQVEKETAHWHSSLVSGDTRRFMGHWTRIVLSSTAFESWLFPKPEEINSKAHISPYDYQRTLFKGGYSEYPGSSYFDLSTDNPKSPLVVNLFNLEIDHLGAKGHTIRNIWAPVRVLQYISNRCAKPTRVGMVIDELSKYFDRDCVTHCLAYFIWTRLIDETSSGMRALADQLDWTKIAGDPRLASEAEIVKTPTTDTYARFLLSDYTYVSTVCVTSLLNSSHILGKEIPLTQMPIVQMAFRFEIIFQFYETLGDALIDNLRRYQNEHVLEGFKSIWLPTNRVCRPWYHGLENAQAAISGIASTSQHVPTVNMAADTVQRLRNLQRLKQSRIESILTQKGR